MLIVSLAVESVRRALVRSAIFYLWGGQNEESA